MTRDDLVRLAEVRVWTRTGKAASIRRRAGLSLAEVGRAVGVGSSTVLRWERGERTPRGDPALRYLEILATLGRRR